VAVTTGEPRGREPLPAELERRIATLESESECGDDFDLVSYVWLFLLGILLPLVLLAIGWWG